MLTSMCTILNREYEQRNRSNLTTDAWLLQGAPFLEVDHNEKPLYSSIAASAHSSFPKLTHYALLSPPTPRVIYSYLTNNGTALIYQYSSSLPFSLIFF